MSDYKRTGIRLRLRKPPYRLDLDSVEVAAIDVCATSNNLSTAAAALKLATADYERAAAAKQDAIKAFRAALVEYEVARGNLSHVEAGNVSSKIKDLPLPPLPDGAHEDPTP